MVAKMPKVNGRIKKVPHIKRVSKTSLVKKKKVCSVGKETSFKAVKKEMKKLKKKTLTGKLDGKKRKLKKKLTSSCTLPKEESTSDLLKTSEDKDSGDPKIMKIQGHKIKVRNLKVIKKLEGTGIKKKGKKNLKKKKSLLNRNKDPKEQETKQEQTCEIHFNAEEGSSSQDKEKLTFKELPPLSFAIDTEIDNDKKDEHITQEKVIRYTTLDAVGFDKLKHEERMLADDLFGDIEVRETTEESALTTVFEEDRSNKMECESNIPDDPFDIHEVKESPTKKKPAWVDDDDENIRVMDVVSNMVRARGKRGTKETSEKKYESELREKFSNMIGGTPDWADLNNIPKDLEEESDLVRKTGNYLSGKPSVGLPKKNLEYKQMLDLNSSHTEGALIQAIDFSSDLQLALVAGSHRHLGVVSLFQVDGNNNHRIHSVRFPNYPVTSAHFLQDGKRFVLGSESHAHFFVYDLEASKETRVNVNKKFEGSVKNNLYINPDGETFAYLDTKGKMFLYDTLSLSLIDILESPFPVTSATFNSDGTRMYTYGLTGEVCVWDMTSRLCIHRFHDEGCISGDVIAMSPSNQYLACGSRSGIVNIYDSSALLNSEPTPVKVLSNLTTPVTALSFNASSEILAMASNRKPNAVKLVHFPSMTVFENFPNLRKELKKILTLRFSPRSGYFCVGDVAGSAPLFRLKHYTNY